MARLEVRTGAREEMVDITTRVQELVRGSEVSEGVAVVSCRHTTAALTLNENADPDVARDLLEGLRRLVPHMANWQMHTEGNSDAHIKSSLLGHSVCVPIERGRLAMGTWQAMYFCEFDGPRTRTVTVVLVPGK